MNLETLKLYCDVVRLRSFSRGAAANAVYDRHARARADALCQLVRPADQAAYRKATDQAVATL